MKSIIISTLAAVVVAGGMLATASNAEAQPRYRGGWYGPRASVRYYAPPRRYYAPPRRYYDSRSYYYPRRYYRDDYYYGPRRGVGVQTRNFGFWIR